MKKGDIIRKNIIVDEAHPCNIVTGCTSEAQARQFAMSTDTAKTYGSTPPFELAQEGTTWVARIKPPFTYSLEAKVMWVVEDDASIEWPDGGCNIISVSRDGWYVHIDAQPTYQSTVAQMSIQELQAQIDALRNSRASSPTKVRVAKAKLAKEPVDDDPMAKVLASLPPEKKLELMKKLGMID